MEAKSLAQAIQECVTFCGHSKKPLVCIAEFTLKLRDELGWSIRDAEAVGKAALQVVRSIATSGRTQELS